MNDQVYTAKQGALWIFPDGPNHPAEYLGCTDVGDVTSPQGDLTLMQCFAAWGGWKTVGKKRGAPGPVTTDLTQLTFLTRSYLERIRGQYGLALLERDATGRADSFQNWTRALILSKVRNTSKTISGILMHDTDDDTNQGFSVSAWPPAIEAMEIEGSRISSTEVLGFTDVAMLKISTGITPVKYGVAVTDAAAGKASVWITDDGGSTWTITALPFANTQDIKSCAILDMGNDVRRLIVGREGTGAAVQGQTAYSDDDGVTWVVVSLGGATAGHGPTMGGSIFALDMHHVWLASVTGRIYFSDDAGQSWAVQNAGLICVTPYTGIKFLSDGMTGYAVTSAGVVVKTVDGGINWMACSAAVTGVPDLTCLEIRDADNVWVGDVANELWFTEDGGDSWTQRVGWYGSGGATGEIRSISFANDYVGFMLAYAGAAKAYLYETIDGGATWQQLQGASNSGLAAMYVGSENYVVYVGAVNAGFGFIGISQE